MTKTRPKIEALSEPLLHIFPTLDATDQELSLTLYRLLAKGEPVAIIALAAKLGLTAGEVARRLQSWPGVYYDGEQRVIGYWGLTLRSTTHRLRVDGRELYTWCAWDTLFLPALLGARAQATSVCRGSGEAVHLTVGPHAIESAEPAAVVVSFLLPNPDAVRADLITSFCHYVHFFRSPEAARPWLDEHPETFLLTLAEAYEVGRRRNRLQYSAVLDLV